MEQRSGGASAFASACFHETIRKGLVLVCLVFGLVVLLGARCYTIRGAESVFWRISAVGSIGAAGLATVANFLRHFRFQRSGGCVCVFFRTNRNNAILQRKLALPVIASVRRIVNVERLCELTSRTAGRNWDFGGFCVRAVIV